MYAAPIAQAQRLVEMAQSHLRALLLLAAVERDGPACAYCKVETIVNPEPGRRFLERTLEHVKPRSQGGPDTLDNSLVACRSCNSRRGARPQREYAVMR
jgi:5-methylcytosine-specific restriction endonuclease McrA